MVFREWIKTEIEAPLMTENRRKTLEEVAWSALLKVRDEIIRGREMAIFAGSHCCGRGDPGNLSTGGGRQGLAAGALSSVRKMEAGRDSGADRKEHFPNWGNRAEHQ
jgi:hypothetical protein